MSVTVYFGYLRSTFSSGGSSASLTTPFDFHYLIAASTFHLHHVKLQVSRATVILPDVLLAA